MKFTRREALFTAAAGAVPVAAGASPLPVVSFGPHKISRLIVGGNPVSGNSHWTSQLSQEMLDYFRSDNVKRLLRDCEKAGINTWQSRGDPHISRLLREYRQEGGQIQWIAQTASEITDLNRNLYRIILPQNPLGIYHHGSRTDQMWNSGRIDTVRDALKAIRDTGKRVGLGTHNPRVIDYVESKGWDVDFYMTCVYNLSRPQEEKNRLAGGKAPRELFWDPDRVEMLKRVRQTSRQCLIFKVYGASRLCNSRQQMLDALKLVFQYAKPDDPVVIGMFPKYKDQATENAQLLREAAKTAS